VKATSKRGIAERVSHVLDAAIAVPFPGWARQRLGDRLAVRQLATRLSFDGADRGDRTMRWNTPNTSANAETYLNLRILRNRCRDLLRNEGWAINGIDGLVTALVGCGFRPKFDWASEGSFSDWEERYSFAGLQAKIVQTWKESGEVLIVRRINPKAAKVGGRRVCPLQLLVLEPDFLDDWRDISLPDGGRIVQGVELNATGKIVAYWLFDRHPGDTMQAHDANIVLQQSKRVPAENVIHLYRERRAGQRRGLPQLSPVILKLKDWGDYADAQLLRQKIAAAFAGFLYDPAVEPVTATEQAGGIDETTVQDVIPGSITKLPPGKHIDFPNTPQIQGYEEFSVGTLLAVAAGIGIPYELLTGDFSRVNFASSRMAWLKFYADVDREQETIVEPLLFDPIWRWFEQAALLAGLGGFEAAELLAPDWIAPARSMNDLIKEIKASVDSVRAGFSTIDEELLAMGKNPSDHFKRLAAQQKKLDDLGLILDTDPRHSTRPGTAPIEAGTFDESGAAPPPSAAKPGAKKQKG
jgi:lambda family phage portal protein